MYEGGGGVGVRWLIVSASASHQCGLGSVPGGYQIPVPLLSACLRGEGALSRWHILPILIALYGRP